MGRVIHAVATCQTCGREFDSINAQALAAQHAYKYSHVVVGEVAYAYVYGEKL